MKLIKTPCVLLHLFNISENIALSVHEADNRLELLNRSCRYYVAKIFIQNHFAELYYRLDVAPDGAVLQVIEIDGTLFFKHEFGMLD